MKNLYYEKYLPSPNLREFIDAYWIIENISDSDMDIPVVPDGCMDIIYQNGELVLVGAMSEAIVVTVNPHDYSFGIRFKPAILTQILTHILGNKSDIDYTNQIIPLQDVSIELYNLLNFKEENESLKVGRLNVIFSKIIDKISFDTDILKLTNIISQYQGDIAIKELEAHSQINSKKIERLFKRYIGYSAKRFTNIVRFFYIFKELIHTGSDDLSAKAYDFGYYDQAHFNNEFKKFSNFTPKDEIMSIFYNT